MDTNLGQVQIRNKEDGQQPFVFSFDAVYPEKYGAWHLSVAHAQLAPDRLISGMWCSDC